MTKHADLSFDRAIAFAQDLIRIPGAPGNEGDVAARVMRELVALGFHDVRQDAVGNVIGVAPGNGSKAPVMINSHMDVVDVGDIASWEHPPFDADIADGHLHGRGAMDIKGPLALQTYAAAHFLEHPGAGDVIVAHTVLEERGGWGMASLMSTGDVRPGAVIIGEATGGDICIGHRGRAEVIIELHGLAGHASAPERARNPLWGMPALLQLLQSFTQTLDRDDLLGPSTAAPTMIETLPRSRNVIPDRARIVLDWRVLPGTLPDAALQRVRSHIDNANIGWPDGITCEIRYATEVQNTYTGLSDERRLFTPGFLLDSEHPIVHAAMRTIAESTGRRPAVRPWTFATDGGHSCGIHGIPTIGFAPGEERFAHTNRERLELESARTAYDAYPRLIESVQAAL
jgi:succinyl-diaminopimelate desuccinylase